MPLRPASILIVLYALGYPVGALAVSSMPPMGVLVFRFGLAALILSGWALVRRVRWPTGRVLAHVALSGLLTQGLQFSCLYLALLHGAPAIVGAVIISMNPVVTVLLSVAFLNERLTPARIVALVLGVVAVLAACAQRLIAAGGVDIVIVLLVAALVACASGGVYQQRFCRDVDFRTAAATQNAASLLPAAVLAAAMPWSVPDIPRAVVAVGAVVLLNATLAMTLYVRAISRYGATAVAMLFAVIPAVAGLLSWLILGQRPDIGMAAGLVFGALACWLNSSAGRARRDATKSEEVATVVMTPVESGLSR
jgi:drug/metabolite transporter (DMT)-like permease